MVKLNVVFTCHAILDILALARITLRIVMESGLCRELSFLFSFLHFVSHYQSFEVRTFPLYPFGLSMMRMRIKKRKRQADGGENARDNSNTAPGIFGNHYVPIHNPCPEPNFITCCTPKDKMGPWRPGESTMTPDSTLISSGLCSINVT